MAKKIPYHVEENMEQCKGKGITRPAQWFRDHKAQVIIRNATCRDCAAYLEGLGYYQKRRK